MRESNFYFPAHNKASVSITSALYDRRAIDATSPLPLLSTLTHLSYLTSTSPRIREILCADGGLERLISILRSTGRRMREHRTQLQLRQELLANPTTSITQQHPPQPQQPQPQPNSHPIRASPFRPFVSQQSALPQNISLIHPPQLNPLPPAATPLPTLTLPLQPGLSNQPLSPHPIPTIGLTKEQKQLLWTWSLSFQCVVNIGVRGTESIRTRVVEAGVVPVIISVLGSYLHEMDRVRQQSENLERARKKATLEAAPTPSSLTHSRHLSSSGRTASSSSIDLARPPRPVLSSRTLVHPLPNPSSSSISITGPPSIRPNHHHRPSNPIPLRPSTSPSLPLDSPMNDADLTVTMNSVATTQSSSRLPHQQHRQSHSEQHSSHNDLRPITSSRHDRFNPIPINNSSTDPVLRTGSISPSSVSSSSSLETSRLNINQQHINVASSSSSSSNNADHPSDLIDVDVDPHHTRRDQRSDDTTSPEPRSRVADVMDDRSVADDCEADVVMELVGNDEPGPSNGRQRSRRGTIKASQVNAHKVVHITPLAPPRPTLTELSDDNLPRLSIQTQASPMEGVEGAIDGSDENSASTILYANHQTPRASSARLPSHVGSSRPQQAQFSSSTTETFGSGSEDTPMVTSTESIPQAVTSDSLSSTSETDDSPPLDPSIRVPPNVTHQLPRVITDPEDVAPARTFTTPRRPAVEHINPPVAAPTQPADGLTDQVGLNPPTVRPAAPPSIGSTSLSSPVTLLFRDEDVLLALQLLAYLSKYAHVRAYFHEPANRSTLELTYGSLQDATRALARFTGRFKSDRYERERARDIPTGLSIPGSSRRPSSVQDHPSPADVESTHLSQDLPARAGTTTNPTHSHYPHRSLSSSMMRDRLMTEELSRPTRSGWSSGDISTGFSSSNRNASSYPGSDSFLRPGLPLGGVTLFSTSPSVNNNLPQSLRQQQNAVHGQSASHSMPSVAPTSHYSNHHYLPQQPAPPGGPSFSRPDLDPNYHHHHHHHHHHPSRAPLPHSNSAASLAHLQSTINPLASNVFSYVERFTHQRLPHDPHSPVIPSEIQYWAGVIMRNACRKDETRGGIRQCANMQCGRWESVPREFAKCKRCRKAKYCSKNCQSRAWQHGHRFWCSTRTEGEGSTAVNTNATAAAGEGANSTPNETNETAVDDATRRIDLMSRALVDAAIERLRRTGDTGAAGGVARERNNRREMTGEVSEVGSNIATPPDRDIRAENNVRHLDGTVNNTTNTNPNNHNLPVLPVIINNDGRTVNTTPAALVNPNDPHHLVDERDQIRLLVDNHDNDHIINP